jgi:hypothetical protein
MTNRCKYCARLELGLKWWFCTKDGHHIKEFDGKTYIPDPNWKGCEENFVRSDKVQYLPELYDALMEAAKSYCQAADFDCPKKYCAWASSRKCKALKWLDLMKKVRDGK